MSACVMSWAVLISLLLLVTLVVMAGMALCRLGDVRELWERLRAQLAANDGHLNKFDAVVEWLLKKESMRLDSSHFGCRWFVVPDKDGKLHDWLEHNDGRKRSELAETIYKAHLQAMREHDKEVAKKTKKK